MEKKEMIVPGALRQLKNRTGLRNTINASLTMAWRGLLKIRRLPEQLFDVTLQPILFTLMLGLFDYSTKASRNGLPKIV